MVFLPVLFYCLANNACQFENGAISASIEECINQNNRAAIVLKADPDVIAFQTTCLDLSKPRKADII